ncbi:MAG: bifunctional aspartate kinase/diaminopimelate decarboxylase [Myxococcota bacterium]
MRFIVLKFGGTSVSTLARWKTIAAQAQQRADEGARPVLVCSAVSGVSDLLDSLLPAARRGEHDAVLEQIEAKHRALMATMDLPSDLLDDHFSLLRRLAQGVSLIGEITPRLTARVMSHGELMSTTMGAEWLNGQGLKTAWMDARSFMRSAPMADDSPRRRYLAARIPHDAEPALQKQFADVDATVILTQGFIASSPDEETVLLGRGGSDTSATTIAAKLGAERCEIWTDVPGMFTANPRQIQAARLLKALDYDEAQELASTGAKVLHPAAVNPVRAAKIPMHVRSTPRPDLAGTVVSLDQGDRHASVKAISGRKNLVLIVMESVGMWQSVGFLADVFGCFRARGLSVDLVATSESNVTVSLDTSANLIDEDALQGLLEDLAPLCQPSVIRGCASVSIVGRNIRAVLHELAPVFEVFEEHRIYLVTQAASDLNLTVVIDAAQVDRMVKQLHGLLFSNSQRDETFGPSWAALFEDAPQQITRGARSWWRARKDELIDIAQEHSPAYVYDRATVSARAEEVAGLQNVSQVLYAIKANPHPELMKIARAAGLGFECVSPGEVARVRALFPDLRRDQVLYTPNFAPREDYAAGFDADVMVTLDNLHPLIAWPDLFEGREIFVRIDPGQGRGHHAHVRTGGATSKFGVAADQIDELLGRAAAASCRIVGLHAHAGSGVRTPDNWREVGSVLAELAARLPDVRVLDVGGGLGVPEKPGQTRLDLTAVDQRLGQLRAAFPDKQLWMEPGRYLVAEAGVLLARVTQRKQKGIVRYVGVDAGMHSLIRPALYGAYHQIVNLNRIDDPATETVNIVGPICETGDVLGRDRRMPQSEEGDVLLIGTAGAYGRAMASEYNLRGFPEEILI